MVEHSIAHDVAIESEMAHESLSALTAVIQEGIDRTLAARGGLPPETIAEMRRQHSVSIPRQFGQSLRPEDIDFYNAARECLPKLLDMIVSPPSPSGLVLETTAVERSGAADLCNGALTQIGYPDFVTVSLHALRVLALLRDFDRLLAREAKAREEEREACAKIVEDLIGGHIVHTQDSVMRVYNVSYATGYEYAAAIRARSKL